MCTLVILLVCVASVLCLNGFDGPYDARSAGPLSPHMRHSPRLLRLIDVFRLHSARLRSLICSSQRNWSLVDRASQAEF